MLPKWFILMAVRLEIAAHKGKAKSALVIFIFFLHVLMLSSETACISLIFSFAFAFDIISRTDIYDIEIRETP